MSPLMQARAGVVSVAHGLLDTYCVGLRNENFPPIIVGLVGASLTQHALDIVEDYFIMRCRAEETEVQNRLGPVGCQQGSTPVMFMSETNMISYIQGI
jgi:hypothetical protein